MILLSMMLVVMQILVSKKFKRSKPISSMSSLVTASEIIFLKQKGFSGARFSVYQITNIGE